MLLLPIDHTLAPPDASHHSTDTSNTPPTFMSLLPPSALVFTLPQLEEAIGQFCLDSKFTGDADAEHCRELMAAFLGYFKTKTPSLNKNSEAGEMQTTIVPVHNSSGMSPSSPIGHSEFSSIGKC